MTSLAYISVPITSGKLFYSLCLKDPKRDKQEVMKEVISANYLLGKKLVDKVAIRSKCPVLYPADLVPIHQKWEQAHFQALWLSILSEMCNELHLCKGWEYSNGGVEEFTHVMQLRLGLPKHPEYAFWNTKENEAKARKRMKMIKVFDHTGKELSLREGYELITNSVSWLLKKGFQSEKLKRCLKLLEWTELMTKKGFYQ